jgi:hypothetical protein
VCLLSAALATSGGVPQRAPATLPYITPTHPTLAQLKPISDSHALTVGAEFISQSFLLSSALGLVLVEWYRSTSAAARAAELKREEKALRVAAKEARLADIEGRLAALGDRLQSLEAAHGEHSGLLGSLIPGALGFFSHAPPAQPRLLNDGSVSSSSSSSSGSAVVVAAAAAPAAAGGSRSRSSPLPAAVGALPAAAAAVDVDDVEAQYLAGVEARLHVLEHSSDSAPAAAAAPAPAAPSSSWFGWLFGGWRRGGAAAAAASTAPPVGTPSATTTSATTIDGQPATELR